MELVPIDIIISDIVMPQGTGFDFIQWVRDGGYEVQVIFLTSYAEFDYAKRAISLESVEYLLKPVDYIKLEEAVGRAVSNVKKNQEYQDYREVNRKWHQNYSVLQKNFWAGGFFWWFYRVIINPNQGAQTARPAFCAAAGRQAA